MSLILDALRKMEQERKARQGGNIDIRPEMLGSPRRGEPRQSLGKPRILVAAAIAILAAGMGGGILVARKGTEGLPEKGLSAPRKEIPPEERLPVTVPPSPPVEPSGSVTSQPVPTTTRHSPPAPRKASPTPRSAQTAADPPALVKPPIAAVQPAAVDYPGGDLTVSGIAWQEERSLRRAVVNGNLVGEGAEVAGARVVEIGERRVKFSQGGRTISVTLSSPFQGR